MSLQLILVLLLALALPPALALLAFVVAPLRVIGWADARVREALGVDAHNAASPYARPGFRPVHEELRDVEVAPQGVLPADLEGLYLRNGTNSQFARTDSRHHMFNGAGMLHQLRIAGGRACYSNCFVRTPRFEAERALGREGYMEFGDIAGGGRAALAKMLLERLKLRAGLLPRLAQERNGSATTAVQYHHGRLYCLQETGLPFALRVAPGSEGPRIDGSGAFEDFGGRLAGPFSAHPKIDPATGDWHAFNLDFTRRELHYSVLSRGTLATHRLVHRFEESPAFLHDGFLTPRFAVFPELSLRFRPKGLIGPAGSPFLFDPARRMRFGLLRRDRPEAPPQWFETAHAGHLWHTVNGWEETRADGATELVLIVPVFREYPATVPIHTPLEPHAELMEYRLDVERGTVSGERRLIDGFFERPGINPAWLGRRSRWAWLLDEGAAGGEMGKGVLKLDLQSGERAGYVDYGDCVGGEPLFVPAAGATDEDHGYLLDLLMREDRACLVVIDARGMTELARLPLPRRVPYGVHACWLGRAQLDSLAGPAW